MNSLELRAARERWELTQTQAANMLGVDMRTYQRWEYDEVPIPGPIERLVWLLDDPRTLARLQARFAAKPG